MKIIVKDWFHEKKMNEKKRNVQTTEVFAILKETEKAYNVFVGDANCSMTYWVPKSCVEIKDTEKEGWGESSVACEDYNEAYSNWKLDAETYN